MLLLKNIIKQQQGMIKVFEPTENLYNEPKTVIDGGWDKLKHVFGFNEEQFRFSILKLNRSGFVKEISGTYTGYLGGMYAVTPIATNLFRLVKEVCKYVKDSVKKNNP